MINKLLVPDIGDFEKVEIIEILVKVGDKIKKNDPIVTLESDKSSVEVPSTQEGIVESEKVKISAEWLFEKKTLKNKSYNKENVISFACKIMEQDAKACELNQKGIHSIPYENGVLMPEEYVIKNFHDWLRKKLQLENGKGY